MNWDATRRIVSSGALAVTAISSGAFVVGQLARPEPPVTANAALQLETFTAPDGVGAALPVPDPTVEPVAIEPQAFDAAALVKAVMIDEQLQADAAAEQAAAEQAAADAEQRTSSCAAGDSGFETTKDHVVEAGIELRCRFDVDTVYGVAGRAGSSDHPGGLALDLMVDPDPGEELAEYAVANMDRLSIEYVIYQQRINLGSGWKPMEDRGGITANHMDHVHISFDAR